MIVFFDTSALVKLFVDEAGSGPARQWAGDASLLLVSQLAWVEFQAAMALKRRTHQLAQADIERARERFAQGWVHWQRTGVDATLIDAAGQLAWRHDLRAYDSVQLATALNAAGLVGGLLRFCSFDKALSRAAAAEGIATLGI